MKNERKSLSRRALGAMAAASLCLTPVLSQAATSASALVVGGALNLRQTASLDAKVLSYYRNGAKATILSAGNTWYKVRMQDGKVGYMMAKYLKVTNETGDTTQTPYKARLVNINGGSVVNFRKAPGMNTTVLRTYPVGTEVTVLETGVNWSKVEIDGVTGYVSTYFLK